MGVVVVRGGRAKGEQKFLDGHPGNAPDPRRGAKAGAFHETGDGVDALGRAQPVHIRHYTCSCKCCQVALEQRQTRSHAYCPVVSTRAITTSQTLTPKLFRSDLRWF